LVQENDIHVDLPGLKTFLSYSETDTEKSEFCSIAVLDETADSKATVLKTLNILHRRNLCDMENLEHSIKDFRVAPLWYLRASSFKPAS
jgi:hypothetical protein